MKLECREEISIFLFLFFFLLHMLRLKKKKKKEKKMVEFPVDMNPSEQSEHQDDSAAGGESLPKIES